MFSQDLLDLNVRRISMNVSPTHALNMEYVMT